MRYNLYTSDKDRANKYLVDNIGDGCIDTFGVPRKKGLSKLYVCSWAVDDDSYMIPIIEKGITDGLFTSVENFNNFGWIDDGEI